MANVIDGKAISAKVRAEIKAEVDCMAEKPGLAVVIVGEDPASKVYVRNKAKGCEEVGFIPRYTRFPKARRRRSFSRLLISSIRARK